MSTQQDADTVPSVTGIYGPGDVEAVLEVKQTETPFDPYEHRKVEKPLTNFDVYNLILRGCLGPGILALPEAFKFSGMLNGILDLVLVSIFCTYMFHILITSRIRLCRYSKKATMFYPEAMSFAFVIGPSCFKVFKLVVWIITDFALLLYQLVYLCGYVAYMATDLKRIVDSLYHAELGQRMYVLILIPYLVVILCVKDFKIYSVFAVIGNLMSVASLGFICYYLSEDLPNFTLLPPISIPKQNMLFVLPAIYSLQCIPLQSTVELQMQKGKALLETRGVLCQVYATLTIIYLIVGIMGYWRYEQDITNNLTYSFDLTVWTAQVGIILCIFATFLSYGIQGLVGSHIIWDHYFIRFLNPRDQFKNGFLEYVFRFAIFVGIPVLLSEYVTTELHVYLVIHGVLFSIIGIMFPALMEFCSLWPSQYYGTCNWILFKDLFLYIFGLCILGLSSYHGYRYYTGNMEPEDRYGLKKIQLPKNWYMLW